MVTRLVRFKLTGLFLELAAKYRIGNCLGDVELIEAGMRSLRNAEPDIVGVAEAASSLSSR